MFPEKARAAAERGEAGRTDGYIWKIFTAFVRFLSHDFRNSCYGKIKFDFFIKRVPFYENLCYNGSKAKKRTEKAVANDRIVCFTGHRTIPQAWHAELKRRLRKEILRQIEAGGTVFRAGGALGFDTMAAQTVLELRETHPGIRLELILPCPSQSEHWRPLDVKVYEEILAQADRVRYVSPYYFAGVLQMRNRELVRGAAVCVGYLTDSHTHSGGTAYTVMQAVSGGADFVNLADPKE